MARKMQLKVVRGWFDKMYFDICGRQYDPTVPETPSFSPEPFGCAVCGREFTTGYLDIFNETATDVCSECVELIDEVDW
jgi:hypothetical protein